MRTCLTGSLGRPLGLVLLTMLLNFNLSLKAAEPAVPFSALARLPIKEVTVFKDGHAFVAHEGELPTDSAGNVVMDYLPTPVLGTFWPYAKGGGHKLSSVVVGQHRVEIEHTAL